MKPAWQTHVRSWRGVQGSSSIAWSGHVEHVEQSGAVLNMRLDASQQEGSRTGACSKKAIITCETLVLNKSVGAVTRGANERPNSGARSTRSATLRTGFAGLRCRIRERQWDLGTVGGSNAGLRIRQLVVCIKAACAVRLCNIASARFTAGWTLGALTRIVIGESARGTLSSQHALARYRMEIPILGTLLAVIHGRTITKEAA
jgi:hypothetical protein